MRKASEGERSEVRAGTRALGTTVLFLVATTCALAVSGCVRNLNVLSREQGLLRDRRCVYEVTIPVDLPQDWTWTRGRAAYGFDLLLAKWRPFNWRRALAGHRRGHGAEVVLGTPDVLTGRLRDADLQSAAEALTEELLRGLEGDDVHRIGALEPPWDASLPSTPGWRDFIREARIGRHRIVETPTIIYDDRNRGRDGSGGAARTAQSIALLRQADLVMLVAVSADVDEFDSAKRVRDSLIAGIRFFQKAERSACT